MNLLSEMMKKRLMPIIFLSSVDVSYDFLRYLDIVVGVKIIIEKQCKSTY